MFVFLLLRVFEGLSRKRNRFLICCSQDYVIGQCNGKTKGWILLFILKIITKYCENEANLKKKILFREIRSAFLLFQKVLTKDISFKCLSWHRSTTTRHFDRMSIDMCYRDRLQKITHLETPINTASASRKLEKQHIFLPSFSK